jgi:tetratricopeptide (TPR) repeat protein
MSFGKILGAWEKEHATITLTERVHPFLRARAFIMRGKLKPAADTEIQLEEASTANAQADWSQAAELATRALANKPSAVSTLTLYQIRSLALFEQGRFSESLADLESAESLCEIFPKSSAGFYARVLKAKVLARTRDLSLGRSLLNTLWKQEDLNSESLLALLRAEIDLRRLERKPLLDLCIYSYHVAQHLGDLLYLNLALVDIYYSALWEDRISLKASIEQGKSSYVRIQKLCDEIQSEYPFSTTAQTIKYSENTASEELVSGIDLQTAPHALLISENSLFSFELNQVCAIEDEKVILNLRIGRLGL